MSTVDRLRSKARRATEIVLKHQFGNEPGIQWLREVYGEGFRSEFGRLSPASLSEAEMSGAYWQGHGWVSQAQLDFPAFDAIRLAGCQNHWIW